MKRNDEIIGHLDLQRVEAGEDGGRGYLFGLDRKKPNKYAVVVWSWGGGWDHVSVSFRDRCPSWDEMCQVKNWFFYPDECCIEYHPAQSDYVDIHPYCLHIWRPQNTAVQQPPKIFV